MRFTTNKKRGEASKKGRTSEGNRNRHNGKEDT